MCRSLVINVTTILSFCCFFFVSFLMFSRISQSCIIDYWLDLVVLSDELYWLSSVMNAFCLYYYGCSYNCSEAHCRLKSPQLYFIREKL